MLHRTAFIVAVCFVWASMSSAETPVFREDFSGGQADARWQIHVSTGSNITILDGSAEITADVNSYAHLSRPLGMDNVTVSARIKPSSPAGVTWSTSAFLVWNAGDWCQMGIIPAPGGGRYYAVETRGGVTKENYLNECDPTRWHHVRIQLGRDCVRYLAGDNGQDWRCLRVIERPAEFAGPAASLVAGKGYGRGVAPHANPDLDNDYSDRGQKVVSRIGYVDVQKTPPELSSLTSAERKELQEAGLDPVGKIELRGKADPTFEGVAKYYPPMKLPREAVGVPEHPNDIGVDYLGRIQLSSNITVASSPTVWLEVGDPPAALAAEDAPVTRRLLNGYLPVVILTAKRQDLECEQTVLGWSEGFSPDAELFALVRLRIQAAKGGELPSQAWLVSGPDGKRTGWPLQSTRAGSAQVCLRIPFANPAGASAVTPNEFESILGQTAKFWEATLQRGARFDVPEARVNDAYKAWIAYAQLDVDKINGVYEPHDGIGFYEENYGYSATLHCIALDLYGMHKKAELYLDSILHFQQPDGLYTQNFGLPDQGTLLLALAEHYNLTGDKTWLRRVAKNIVSAGDWIIRKRELAPKTGVTRGLIKFRPYCDYAEPVIGYFADTYCCIGLEKAASALKAIGMEDDAERFRSEAEGYRADILASMDAAAIRKPDRTFLPLEPETHRLLNDNGFTGGEYYGLVACCLLENEFLLADDKRTHWITDLIEQKNGLIAGVSRFGPGGIDHAYAYGYLLTQLKRGDARKVLLGFYGMLAYGMTRDTYSAVECTTVVSGANYWTLPHLYSNTQQLRLLRNMLLWEEGDSLLIGEAIPRAWLADGKKIEVRSAPTRFGDVSFRISSEVKNGRIQVRLSPPTRQIPQRIRIRLRHPTHAPIRAVSLDGRAWQRFKGETIELDGITKPVRLEIVYTK